MPKINRTTQQIFASESGNLGITEFGTAKEKTPTYTKDLSVIQNEDFLNGWSEAILSDKAPYLEDSNGLYYLITSQLAYLLQQGIAEYDANTTYYIGSLVKVIADNGDVTIYKSIVDDNIGNEVTNTLYWSVYSEENPQIELAQYEIGLPTPTLSNNLYANEIWLEGQAVSRVIYANLFNLFGTTYGIGDGSTTFNLPDFRGRTLWGASDFGYISAGLPSMTVDYSGNHNHNRGNMNITGNFWGIGLGYTGGRYYSSVGANGAFTQGAQCGIGGSDGIGGVVFYYCNYDASRTWSGVTNTTGNHTHTITSSIGTSSTVQPPAIKCRVKTRWY